MWLLLISDHHDFLQVWKVYGENINQQRIFQKKNTSNRALLNAVTLKKVAPSASQKHIHTLFTVQPIEKLVAHSSNQLSSELNEATLQAEMGKYIHSFYSQAKILAVNTLT